MPDTKEPVEQTGHPCKVCKTPDDQKPMVFRGEDWCCDTHRKMIVGELPWPTETEAPPGAGGVTGTREF